MNKKVRAKFQCQSVAHTAHDSTILLTAVTGTSEDNKSFWKYTPSGQVTLSCINKETASAFVPGEEYYLDFTHAPKEVA